MASNGWALYMLLLAATGLIGCSGEPDAPAELPPQLAQLPHDEAGAAPFPTQTSSSGLGSLTRASVVTPPTPLITSATVSSNSVCPGASVRVDVATSRDAQVTIDRLPSRQRFMQITGSPGADQLIHVVALEPRANQRPNVEHTTLRVEVRDCGTGLLPYPDLTITQGWDVNSPVKFTVENSLELNATSYDWDFGDGTRETTSVPAVDHYYGLDKLGYHTQFNATVTARMASGATSTWKSLLISMPQWFALQKGIVQPFYSQAYESGGRQWMLVYNHTNEAMTLTGTSYRYLWCDRSNPARTRTGTLSLSIPARGYHVWALDTSGGLNGGFEYDPQRRGICGAHGYFTGRTASGKPVQAPFAISYKRLPHLTRPVADPYLLSMLKSLEGRGEFDAKRAIAYEKLDKLAREKRLSVNINLLPKDFVFAPVVAQQGGLPQGAAGAAGDEEEKECFPGSSERPPDPNFTCQATEEYLEDLPYLANAFAGDIVESAACGSVGSLLRAVHPAQYYTHVGIMTSHNDRIRHSTMEVDRLYEHKEGFEGKNGTLPSVLRWARPGVLPQTVYESYAGAWWQDDEYPGDEYMVSGFNADPAGCQTDEHLTFPVVVSGAWSELGNRQRIAAEADTIKGHYRVYGYTQGAIVEDAAYDQPNQEEKLQATVCSTFIWAAARQAGFSTLEGALDTSDVQQGAFRDASTLDGQYYYTPQERRAAAQALYSAVYNRAKSKAFGPRGNIDFDGAENWGNQVVNCFASDYCATEAKDSDAWKDTGEGRTVSPDHILYWDGPLYGSSEQLAFRSGQFRRKHVWRAAVGTGALTATVRTSTGALAEGANVIVQGESLTGRSSVTGQVTFNAVKAGCHQVVATKTIDGQLVRGEARACVTAGSSIEVSLRLSSPTLKRRQVLVRGTLHLYDDHPWPFGGESKDFAVNVTGQVNPDAPSATEGISEACVGNEVVSRAHVNFQLKADGSVDVQLDAKLYEGESCKTTDKGGSGDVHINVRPNEQGRLLLRVENDGWLGERGDYASFNLEVSNLPDF
jgi:hypothetical protein